MQRTSSSENPGPSAPKPGGPQAGGDQPPQKSSNLKYCAIGCAILVVLGILAVPACGILGAIAVPNFRAARDRANMRACFANQKTIAGAIEMYNLDENTEVTALSPDTIRELIEGGYIRSFPECPAHKEIDPPGPYALIIPAGEDRAVTFCMSHGFINPPPGATAESSPRDQLKAAGITDTSVLNRVNPNSLPGSRR